MVHSLGCWHSLSQKLPSPPAARGRGVLSGPFVPDEARGAGYSFLSPAPSLGASAGFFSGAPSLGGSGSLGVSAPGFVGGSPTGLPSAFIFSSSRVRAFSQASLFFIGTGPSPFVLQALAPAVSPQ